MNAQLNLPTSSLAAINVDAMGSRFYEAINASLDPKLDALSGMQVLFSPDDKEFSPLEGWEAKNHSANIQPISAVDEPAAIAAIDSSCVLIGETSDGSIYSAKCGLALSFMGKAVMHVRIGPVLFYINDDTVRSSNLDGKFAKFVLFDTSAAKRMIRVRVERVIQNEISKFLRNAIILVDGSLKNSVFEDSINGLKHILQNCLANENQLVGISKTTKLKVLYRLASLMRKNGACYIDVESIVKSLVSNIIGRPLLAKFSSDGIALRVDVLNKPSESLGKLITNDALPDGYPETLRLAHHISTFTKTDVSCIRSFVLSRFSTREMMREDVRRTLLGTLSVRGF
ncbi:MAG: hypothetical protein ACE5J2_05695 [Nitrososphaerales archaeon]